MLLIAGNWKMNLNHLEAIALVQKVAFSLPDKYLARVEVVVLPPFTDLRSVQTLVDGDKLGIAYGAQDLAAADAGAFTGDISGPMLAKLGCSYVVVGHSERREIHQESDAVRGEQGRRRLPERAAADPVCGGEARRPGGRRPDRALASRSCWRRWRASRPSRPPTWWSPTSRSGRSAPAGSPPPRTRRRSAVRCARPWPSSSRPEIAAGIRILYGGSVKSSNVAEIVAEADVDGALVGGASLDGTDFALLAANSVGILS